MYDEEDGAAQEQPAAEAAEDSGIPERDIKLIKDVTQIIKAEPFYGDASKDKGCTVIDFVEKVETGMNDFMSNKPQYRLLVVRTFLREGALRWISIKLKELHEAARQQQPPRDLNMQPIEWDADLRRPFLQAYVGTDTVDVWMSKLSALKLGQGKTKSPIELENEFDSIARHIIPTMTVSGEDRGVDMLLAQKYKDIIANSKQDMFEQIVLYIRPRTLKQWKLAVVDQWNAEETLKASRLTRKAMTQVATPYGGYQSRGGSQGRGRGEGRTQSVHAISKDEQMDGEWSSTDQTGQTVEEGQPGEQASAAGGAGGGSRGGRGAGRGGRGRGGRARSMPSAEKQRRYAEGLCYNCGKPDHLARDCPTPKSASEQQEGKAAADK